MNILGVIPARGGSKGVLRKNLREVGGRSLVGWAVRACRDSQMISNFVVSSEDGDILDHARDLGVVGHVRGVSLAQDGSSTVSVIQEVLSCARCLFNEPDLVVIVQPTSPMRVGADIDGTIRAMLDSGSDSAISVVDVGEMHPARMYRMGEYPQGEFLKPLETTPTMLRQDLSKVYHRNGAVYVAESGVYRRGTVFGNLIAPYEMPMDRSINIDTEFDLKVADLLMTDKLETKREAESAREVAYSKS